MHRGLRLARRLLGATAAAWVELGREDRTAVIGDLAEREARTLAALTGRTGAVLAATDLSGTPEQNALRDRFRWLLAVPVLEADRAKAVVLVLGSDPRSLSSRDAEALTDLGTILLAASLRSEGGAEPEGVGRGDRPDLLEAAPDTPLLIQVLDANGRVTHAVGQARAWMDLPVADENENTATGLYDDDDALRAALESAMAGETTSYKSAVGDRMIEHHVMPLLDEEGVARGAVSIAMDVSRRWRGVEGGDRVEPVLRDQSTFLAAMSHEIRTPLTGIIGFADVLVDVAEGDARAYAELIQTSGHRLLQTLNSVLNLARLEADQVPIRLAEIDLAEEAHDAARLLQPLAEHKDLAFTVNVQPARVATDPTLVHRIITNLIANAIKFTDEGSVSVNVAPEGDGALIEVVDTGRGMKPEFLPLLFKPFKREMEGPTRPGGTGLGLSITKRLVDLLGGTISVESEFGKGSRFSVHLPASVPSDVGPWSGVAEPVLEWRTIAELDIDDIAGLRGPS